MYLLWVFGNLVAIWYILYIWYIVSRKIWQPWSAREWEVATWTTSPLSYLVHFYECTAGVTPCLMRTLKAYAIYPNSVCIDQFVNFVYSYVSPQRPSAFKTVFYYNPAFKNKQRAALNKLTRVTSLGTFLPVGRLISLVSFFWKKYRSSPNLWATFMYWFCQKMGWSTFWATFEQTHLG
jgi:hypothetical protein